MNGSLVTALLTGAFALAGGLGGVLLTSKLNRQAQERLQETEDARRWLKDRREIYARFTSKAEAILRAIDSTAVFMSYDGSQPPAADDIDFISEGTLDNSINIDNELEPILFEIQLMASSEVADLADRVCGSLREINGYVAVEKAFIDYYPAWFQALDLVEILRNGMRRELGLIALESGRFPRDHSWPWLPGRPPRESYIQKHPAR